MTDTEQIFAAALDLPAEERTRLIDVLLKSLEGDDAPVTEAERAELDRRLDADRRDPSSGASWPEVRVRLLTAR